MFSRNRLALPFAAFFLMIGLAGCASSGQTFQEMQSQAATPSAPAGDGRIYIYRVNSPLGAGVQPAIKVNGEKVGDAVPNGFVFVDRPAGNYEISTSTEVDRTLSLTLAANETKYVRLGISMGFFIGHVYPELVEPAKGEAELTTLHHLASE